MQKTVMITGGFGFIGTNLVKLWRSLYPGDRIVIMDANTYAADPAPLLKMLPAIEISFTDIRHEPLVKAVLQQYRPDLILHLAAESHVCRSIEGPRAFVETNINGTFNLLEGWRYLHDGDPFKPFIHVSTDEVFGQLEPWDAPFTEQSAIRPRSPYAASKAASDLLALAYWETYSVPVRVTNCSNNFGPHQHNEKLIPATIERILAGKRPRIYGDGYQVRDWIYVWDHCRALVTVATSGMNGERYCIGGDREMRNLDMVKRLHDLCAQPAGKLQAFEVDYLDDARPTDDRRYAIDSTKIKTLGWQPYPDLLDNQLRTTIGWYLKKLEGK